jgi:hypothetical protein
MKIIQANPPVYDAIIQAGLILSKDTIFTYGDTIYNPNKVEISDHMQVHEQVHSKQQGTDPDAWWGRYLMDSYFRIEQESEAYGMQYKYLCTKFKDRNRQNRILIDLSFILSGPLYGSVIERSVAQGMIKESAKNGIQNNKKLI